MCFGGGGGPSQPTVDPEAERRKLQEEAQAKDNEQLLADAKRKRKQKGLLASADELAAGSVLSSAAPVKVKAGGSTVLGSGGA